MNWKALILATAMVITPLAILYVLLIAGGLLGKILWGFLTIALLIGAIAWTYFMITLYGD